MWIVFAAALLSMLNFFAGFEQNDGWADVSDPGTFDYFESVENYTRPKEIHLIGRRIHGIRYE